MYSLGGGAVYQAGSVYFSGLARGDLGHGNESNAATGGTGGFSINGYAVSGGAGKIFTLIGPGYVPPTPSSAMPTKAPPRPNPSAYSLQFDLSGHLLYRSETSRGFTDSVGFAYGDERLRYWDIGAVGRLFATIPSGGLVWSPWVQASIDQQLGFSDTLAIPTQPGFAGDTISIGSPQTVFGEQVGIQARDKTGIIVGVQGNFAQSAEYQIVGGTAYIRYVFPE
jgi:hypothetical protein